MYIFEGAVAGSAPSAPRHGMSVWVDGRGGKGAGFPRQRKQTAQFFSLRVARARAAASRAGKPVVRHYVNDSCNSRGKQSKICLRKENTGQWFTNIILDNIGINQRAAVSESEAKTKRKSKNGIDPVPLTPRKTTAPWAPSAHARAPYVEPGGLR